jgi:hypothetical protein
MEGRSGMGAMPRLTTNEIYYPKWQPECQTQQRGSRDSILRNDAIRNEYDHQGVL